MTNRILDVFADDIVVSVTVLGDTGDGGPVLRSGAHVGDVVALSEVARVEELARMLSGMADSELARAHAEIGRAHV